MSSVTDKDFYSFKLINKLIFYQLPGLTFKNRLFFLEYRKSNSSNWFEIEMELNFANKTAFSSHLEEKNKTICVVVRISTKKRKKTK